MSDFAMTCEECGGEVVVTVGPVRPHPEPRAIFTCVECGHAFITTEPGIVERLLVARCAQSEGSG